jgi:hypothetical protein
LTFRVVALDAAAMNAFVENEPPHAERASAAITITHAHAVAKSPSVLSETSRIILRAFPIASTLARVSTAAALVDRNHAETLRVRNALNRFAAPCLHAVTIARARATVGTDDDVSFIPRVVGRYASRVARVVGDQCGEFD